MQIILVVWLIIGLALVVTTIEDSFKQNKKLNGYERFMLLPLILLWPFYLLIPVAEYFIIKIKNKNNKQ